MGLLFTTSRKCFIFGDDASLTVPLFSQEKLSENLNKSVCGTKPVDLTFPRPKVNMDLNIMGCNFQITLQ